MNGQWIGKFQGSNSGTLVLDLDDRGSYFEGYAYAYADTDELPSTYVYIKTIDKRPTIEGKVSIFPLDPKLGGPTTWEKISGMFPAGTAHGKMADVKIIYHGKTLEVSWTTDIGATGSAILPASRADDPTEYTPLPEVTNWRQFKEFVSELEYRRYIYRGQAVTKRLRTSFHRTGRADLNTFLDKDIKTLHRHLSHRTKHIFNLSIPDQNGAFFSLVQHHGYPTPLLDWSYSPFVSAFFAYRNKKIKKSEEQSNSDKVRIFLFDQKEWCRIYNQVSFLVSRPHFSVMEFIAIENERMVPQQGISSVTNIDDIETYIRSMEKDGISFLKIIDLPVSERSKVISELSTMGITAGSLFPGLDGACEEVKERLFQF